jgi:hypothetical protein
MLGEILSPEMPPEEQNEYQTMTHRLESLNREWQGTV